MSAHTLKRIADLLTDQFGDMIDMDDYANRSSDQREMAFLSRAVAAQCLKHEADLDPPKAAECVTDGFHDEGIDALLFDQLRDTFYFVSSKWSNAGKNAFDANAARAFVDGIRKILSEDLGPFNDKFQKRRSEIIAGLRSTRHIKYIFIIAHAADAPIAQHVRDLVDSYVNELNGTVNTARSVYFDQAGIYGLVTEPPKINLTMQLRHYGRMLEPHLAYYGYADTTDVAEWWKEHGDDLCFRNLRHFMRDSSVNSRLRETLKTEPHNFWYFNNGITIICDEIIKQPIGGTKTDVGVFICKGVSVVNGAQTVGTIGTVLAESGSQAAIGSSWIQIRLLSMAGAPPDLAEQITRSTNFQNAVTNRDFAAMDPLQLRLARELVILRRTYAFKSGEADPQGELGCSITEATIALACAHSVGLAVLAKRELGALWADTKSPPYTTLFNDQLTADRLWQHVVVLRAVDQAVHALGSSPDYPRSELIATHLNRLILHLVFSDPRVRQLIHPKTDERLLQGAATASTLNVFALVADYVEHVHKGEYLASLAKNGSKCEELVRSISLGNVSSNASAFDSMMRALVQVPSEELKQAMEVEKAQKKKRQRRK